MTGAFVIGPKADSDRIPGIDQGLEEGDTWMIGDSKLKCFETPGHTLHGLAFHFESADVIFTGETPLQVYFCPGRYDYRKFLLTFVNIHEPPLATLHLSFSSQMQMC